MTPYEIRYESLGMARQDANLLDMVSDLKWLIARAEAYERFIRDQPTVNVTIKWFTDKPEQPNNWSA